MRGVLLLAVLLGLAFSAGASAVTMEMVAVGEPGNPPDTLNTNAIPGIGSVDYEYQIGKFEVRNSEYAEFLNAVAAIGDSNGLYAAKMGSYSDGGITRTGSGTTADPYVYAPKPDMAERPVNYVNFNQAARFVNWLQNGQPRGMQGPGTTETGTYTLFTSGSSTTNASARAAGATWVIPTENEWYKAAYYDPGPAGPSDGYWLYPTRSDDAPSNDLVSPDPGNSANFYQSGNTLPEQPFTTVAGEFENSASHYGTFDQGGNVFELNETVVGSDRGARGGFYHNEDISLRSTFRSSAPADLDAWIGSVGFRVAAIQAPPSVELASPTTGDIHLTLRGSVGFSHIVEVSDNLTHWQPWAVVTLPADGWSTNFPVEPNAPRYFWRARSGSAPSGFVLIPPGSFTMGDSLAEGNTVELPVHTVYVSAFYMQAKETTKAQWDEVRAWGLTNGYTDLPTGGGKALDHPVQTVTWYDVVKWCNARSQMEGLMPCYTVSGATYMTGSSNPACDFSANGYRLPTEAEWEKAARGGAGGHRFPWSDADTITHSRANFNSSTSYAYDVSPTRGYHPAYNDGVLPYTSPVGAFAANGYGLYDMAGNVLEWCWDWYGSDYYSTSPSQDPAGPTTGWFRVVRGGIWTSSADLCRVAYRLSLNPASSNASYGFRPVRR